MTNVYWLIRAQRRLRASMAEPLAAATTPTLFHQKLEELNDLLARTFPDAEAIVVRDRLLGYRDKPGFHALLVEVIPRPGSDAEPSTHIVKIGDPKKLAQELAAWANTHTKTWGPIISSAGISSRWRWN